MMSASNTPITFRTKEKGGVRWLTQSAWHTAIHNKGPKEAKNSSHFTGVFEAEHQTVVGMWNSHCQAWRYKMIL
jgi:hypothetical protein